MAEMTISEGLQSIKTATSRIAKKRAEVQTRIAYDGRLQDPLAKAGGSEEFIKSELQAINDLEGNVLKTRLAIQKANFDTELTIGKFTMTVAGWLVWRREISGNRSQYYNTVNREVQRLRQAVLTAANTRAALNAEDKIVDVKVNVNEKKWAEESEELDEVLGQLDGRLSAFNATHTIDV